MVLIIITDVSMCCEAVCSMQTFIAPSTLYSGSTKPIRCRCCAAINLAYKPPDDQQLVHDVPSERTTTATRNTMIEWSVTKSMPWPARLFISLLLKRRSSTIRWNETGMQSCLLDIARSPLYPSVLYQRIVFARWCCTELFVSAKLERTCWRCCDYWRSDRSRDSYQGNCLWRGHVREQSAASHMLSSWTSK